MSPGGGHEKGKNKNGGTYGNSNVDVEFRRSRQTFHDPKTTLRAASQTFYQSGQNGWSTQVQDPVNSGQKYQFCQINPIIVRGKSNIDPNHLAIRNINGNIHCPTTIPTWKCNILKGELASGVKKL